MEAPQSYHLSVLRAAAKTGLASASVLKSPVIITGRPPWASPHAKTARRCRSLAVKSSPAR
eukprot:6576462-Pyramimonas_sp.AAC.1